MKRPLSLLIAPVLFAALCAGSAAAQDAPTTPEKAAAMAKENAARSKKAQTQFQLRTAPDQLKLLDVGNVAEIGANGEVIFRNGRKVKLDNIRIPAAALDAARAVLEETLSSVDVGIYVSPDAAAAQYTDNTGFTLAHLVTEKNVWVQKLLVTRGLAWHQATPSDARLGGVMMQDEDTARKAALGFWKIPAMGVKTDQNISIAIGSYQVYEGTVRDVVKKGSFHFVRFSANPKGLALVISDEMAMRILNTTQVSVQDFVNMRVRLRGWVEDRSGPAIVMTETEQLQMLSKPSTKIERTKKNQTKKAADQKKPPEKKTKEKKGAQAE